MLAKDKSYRRLILDTSPSSEERQLRLLPDSDIFRIDTGKRIGSETHGFGVNELIKRIETDYALIIDPDALLLCKDWDTILKAELTDQCIAIGTPYNPSHGRRRHQDFPNAICFFFRVAPLKAMKINWEPLAFRWRLPLMRVVHSRYTRHPLLSFLAINDLEMGWRVPGMFRKYGYQGKAFEFIRPDDPTAELLKPELWFEEYRWNGQLIASHQRRSQHAFNTTPHSSSWVRAVTQYLEMKHLWPPAAEAEIRNLD